jgi:hypothetical protein
MLRKGRIDPELFAQYTEAAVKDIRDAKQDRRIATSERGRTRGADYFRQRILQAKRAGDLSEEEADLAEWFIARNPELLDDLGISIRLARTTVEIVVLVVGLILGGSLGLGTFVFAFGIGPLVQKALHALRMSPSLNESATGQALEM